MMRYLAVQGPGDYVTLLPVGTDATGPDVFIHLNDLPLDRLDPWHTVVLDGMKPWTLVHPITCNLDACQFYRVATEWTDPHGLPPGRYAWMNLADTPDQWLPRPDPTTHPEPAGGHQ